MKALKINNNFNMNCKYRESFPIKKEYEEMQHKIKEEEEIMHNMIPFFEVIDKIKKIEDFQSPMVKLEHIFKCCTTEI
jgi:hypothetical protein